MGLVIFLSRTTVLALIIGIQLMNVCHVSADEVEDDEFIEKFDDLGYQTACSAMSASDPEQLKMNLSRPVSYEEGIRLVFWIKGLSLKSSQLEFPEDIKWKRTLVNLMFNIYTEGCPDEYVRHEYLNIFRELAMIYLNSVEPRESSNMDVWEAITKSLQDCDDANMPAYNFTSRGLLINGVKKNDPPPETLDGGDILGVAGGNGEAGNEVEGRSDPESGSTPMPEAIVFIRTQFETVEILRELDIIIDNLWTVFSHAWGRCYPSTPSRELWGPRFKRLFFQEFLAPFESRWRESGRLKRFLETAVGDFDLARMQYNIPYCLQAAYVTQQIEPLQLVRPLRTADFEEGIRAGQNSKYTI